MVCYSIVFENSGFRVIFRDFYPKWLNPISTGLFRQSYFLGGGGGGGGFRPPLRHFCYECPRVMKLRTL